MTTLAWIFTFVCGLPLLAIVILGIVIAIWGIKTVWKIVTWPFRAIAGLFHKKSESSPAPVAAPAAPVQDDRNAHYGAPVTQTQTVTVNSGAGGTALAIIALVVVLAILALGAFLIFGQNAAAPVVVVPPCNGCLTTPVVPVVVAATPCPEGVNCPVGRFISASPDNNITLLAGHWYHLNISVNGAPAGVETNVFIQPKMDLTIRYDGSAWEYGGTMPSSDCQICVETRGDNWRKIALLPESLVTYSFPCGETIVADYPEIIYSVNSDSDTGINPDLANPSIVNGIVVQGELVSGTIPATAWAGLYWWTPGQPEKVLVFRATTDVTVSNFRGTLVMWDHTPTSVDIGNKPTSTIDEVKAAGVTFSGDFSQ